MQYLPCLTSADAEITIEKLDKVAKTLSDRIKSFAKFFGIFIGWCIFNVIVSLFFSRTRSLSIDAYRMITEGLREAAMQDFSVYLAFFFENKINCIITLAVLFVCGGGYLCLLANVECRKADKAHSHRYSHSSQNCVQCYAYVVSYKHQVAFLA